MFIVRLAWSWEGSPRREGAAHDPPARDSVRALDPSDVSGPFPA